MTLGTATILRGDARNLPLPDASVDLIVTSPPYWGLRSYTDNGQHYQEQIGSEATPAAYIDTLLDCTSEWMRVLKPTGSLFVNLSDVYSSGQRFDHEFTVEDAAWLGGVIDSDGSISIRVDAGGRSHIAWTRIGQMRREVVERAGSITGTGQVYQDARGVWNWNAAGQQARWVLERIWPWLHIKRRQALAAVHLQEIKGGSRRRGRWNPLSDDEIRDREIIRQAVLAWNRGEDVTNYDPPLQPLPKLSNKPRWIPPKSLMLLPERYAIGCIDDLGMTLRRDIIWHKTTALPESVTDRCATRHEYLFHLVKQERYYAAVDRIREEPSGYHRVNAAARPTPSGQRPRAMADTCNPLGRLPGSVWDIAGEPLTVPDDIGADHYAAYPTELPRRAILGWSPSGWCSECGEPRRPQVVKERVTYHGAGRWRSGAQQVAEGAAERGWAMDEKWSTNARLLGEACRCPQPTAPTRPAVVLDPFGGTGTTALVAKALGRHGISVDRSADYCRIARWRTTDPAQVAKALGVPKPPPVFDGQVSLFDLAGGAA